MSRAPQIRTKHPSAAKNAIVSFADELESGETLTGSPTITSSPSGLTIANEKVSTGELTLEDGTTVVTGEAVQFKVSGGTSGVTYQIEVSCATTSSPAQTLVRECILTVINT